MSRSTIRITPDRDDFVIEFVRADGSIEFGFNTVDIAEPVRDWVFAYGAKQILADGGAVGRNVPDAERLAKMEKRADALRDGSWGFRDGHGTPKPESELAAMYNALIAAGAFADDDANRALWKSLTPTAKRAAFAAFPAAADHMPKTPTVDGAAILERFI